MSFAIEMLAVHGVDDLLVDEVGSIFDILHDCGGVECCDEGNEVWMSDAAVAKMRSE